MYFLDFRSDFESDPDLLFTETDPFQVETDPKHWLKYTIKNVSTWKSFRSNSANFPSKGFSRPLLKKLINKINIWINEGKKDFIQ